MSLIRLPGATEELRLWGQVGTLWEPAVPYLLLTSGESRHLWETRPLRSDMGTILCLLCAHHVFPLQWLDPTARNNRNTKITDALVKGRLDFTSRH